MARTNSKGIAILKGLALPLSVGGKELGRLDDALRMLHVAMRNISFVAVLRNRRGGSLILVRETPQKERKKQRSNEQYARDIAG